MARVRIRVESHPAAYQRLYDSRAVGENMFQRGLRVETRAKQNLNLNTPRRVDTGRLRASIGTSRIRVEVKGFMVRGARVGTRVFYGRHVHEGTGLYGPRKRLIVPIRAKALRFKPKGEAGFIYVKSVKGMKPNRFLTDAIPAAKLG